MRILFTSDPEIPVPPELYGGIQRIIYALTGYTKHHGFQTGLIAHQASSAPVDSFYPWPGLNSQVMSDSLANMLALRKAVSSFRPDIIHSFSRLQYLAPLACSAIPKIMSYQREPSIRTTTLAHHFIRKLQFTGCSHYICKQGERNGASWKAIYNFVDVSSISASTAFEKDAPLVFLSRLDRIKAPHLAIQLAHQTKHRLILAGNHATQGPEAEYFAQQIAPLIDNDLISYVGPVNDKEKYQLLRTAKALCVPIQWDEPFGIVFAEALACGTPVITTPRGAAPEIVRNGIDGYLCNSMEELCVAVDSIGLLSRESCRKRAEDTFSLDVVGPLYIDLYRSLIA